MWKKHKRAPSVDELKGYIQTWTPSQLNHVRQSAEQSLASYATDVIAEEEPRILRQAIKGAFWPAVLAGMAAVFLYTLLLMGVVIILARAGVDILGILKLAAGGGAY